jgi:glycosyltransferase involved in cell wall biosynthesis
LITYLEARINDYLGYEEYVNHYIAPSQFLRYKFIEYGYDPDRITHLPNFIELDDLIPHYHHENYLLYIGRLENGKGLLTMVKGFAKAMVEMPSMMLKIAGTGSIEEELSVLVHQMGVTNIDFLGFKQGDELENLTKKAKATIIPSELYENYPFSGLESMAYGKPIIASRIGGIPEQVEDGVTGFLFDSFSEDDLCEKIKLLCSLTNDQIKEMGRQARKKVERDNDKTTYLKNITQVYKALLQVKRTENLEVDIR